MLKCKMMNPDEIKKTINYWIEGAKRDMTASEVLLKEKQFPQALFGVIWFWKNYSKLVL